MILALAAFLACSPAAQEVPVRKAELQFQQVELESPAGERSGMPHLAQGPDGRVTMSWLEGLEGASARFVFAPLTSAGWGPAQTIAEGDDWFNNWADRPSIAALGDGGLIAHWLQRMGPGTYAYGVRFSISRDAGAQWDEARWLHEDRRPVEHGFASFVAIDAQTFGAVWLDGRVTGLPGQEGSGFAKGPQQLYFRTIELSGKLGPESCLDDSVCDCCPTALTALGRGELALGYRDRTSNEVRDVNLSLYKEGTWSPPQSVDEEPWEIPGCPVNGPSLDALGQHFGLAWYTAAGEVSQVRAAIGSRGEPQPESVVVDLGAPEGRAASVMWDADTLLVCWLEHMSAGPTWMLRSVSSGGSLGQPQALARVLDGRASGYARLARSGTGLIFAWTDPKTQKVRTLRLEPSLR